MLPSFVHDGFKNWDLPGNSLHPPSASTVIECYSIFMDSKTKLHISYYK